MAPPAPRDAGTVVVLLLLYTLHGATLAGASGMQVMLIEKGAGDAMMSVWQCRRLPGLLKVFFAPVIDTCFVERFGRRKTWIVPCGVLTGLNFLAFGPHVAWLVETGSIWTITGFYTFALLLLCAQDVAIDGWAISVLGNVTWQTTCNSAGAAGGYVLAIAFYLLSEKDMGLVLVGFGAANLAQRVGAAPRGRHPRDPRDGRRMEPMHSAFTHGSQRKARPPARSGERRGRDS